jgi:putative acetyltransferase
MQISLESPDQPDVLQLIEALDAYQRPLYPAESHHGMDLLALCATNVLFAVARDRKKQPVACGAIVLESWHAELKRMYTSPAMRGKGIARSLVDFLETQARQRGYSEFALETGYLQPGAIALYTRCGYEHCGPFGGYAEDPNSVFMRKKVSSN